MSRPALVTGGARRVGREIVRQLAHTGRDVAIHCRTGRADADALAAAIRETGRKAVVLEADLMDETAPAALLDEATAALGQVGLLVNNASVFEHDDAMTVTETSWRRHMQVNLRAPFLLSQAMARSLPHDAKGCIVNIIDQRVWRPTPQFMSYTLSKSALWTLTQTLAQALAPRIRVNAVGPGPVLQSRHQDAAAFAAECASVPLAHGASPAEIAEAVGYLAGAEAVTGQMIAVDGGQHLAWQTPDVLAELGDGNGRRQND